MTIRKPIVLASLSILGLAVSHGALAECVQGEGADQAQYTILVDGTTSCANLQQSGCRVDKPDGSCTAYKDGEALFTAHIDKNNKGSISWTLEPGAVAGVDAVLVGGGQQGNACGYIYPDRAGDGQSGLGFQDSRGKFSNVTYVEVCVDTEGGGSSGPDVDTTIPECPAPIAAALNQPGTPPGFALYYQFHPFLGATTSFCIKGGPLTDPVDPSAFEFIGCTNEPTDMMDEHDPETDEPLCSEVVSPISGEPIELRNSLTTDIIGGQGSSCVYTCMPPPLTVDGRNQCGVICL